MISTKGRYALRVMIDLAEHRNGSFIPPKDIAARQEISKKYLEIIVKTMVEGGLTGGFNFDAKTRRPSYTAEDMFHAYILGMDTFALGLLKAAALIEDGRIDAFVKERYESFRSGIGKKIRSGQTSLEELADYAEKMGAPDLPGSGRQEYLESIVNSVLFR